MFLFVPFRLAQQSKIQKPADPVETDARNAGCGCAILLLLLLVILLNIVLLSVVVKLQLFQ